MKTFEDQVPNISIKRENVLIGKVQESIIILICEKLVE